jgi:hypothetical protein
MIPWLFRFSHTQHTLLRRTNILTRAINQIIDTSMRMQLLLHNLTRGLLLSMTILAMRLKGTCMIVSITLT